MRGIIIAAGPGSRMGVFTQTRPKCLLRIGTRTLLDRTIENLRAVGCDEVVLVTGHKAEMIDRADVITVRNDDYANNNILHSLMYARAYLDGPVITMYSDIWVEPHIYRKLLDASGDIVLSVDRDWLPYYEGRTEHPIDEAENIFVDAAGSVIAAGKAIDRNNQDEFIVGEFLGLWKMGAAGTKIFREAFEELEKDLDPHQPFGRAREWRKSYITDFIQFLVDQGICVDCSLIERGWAELDTSQDYQRLPEIAARQRLETISAHGGEQ
jgi:choline kinase